MGRRLLAVECYTSPNPMASINTNSNPIKRHAPHVSFQTLISQLIIQLIWLKIKIKNNDNDNNNNALKDYWVGGRFRQLIAATVN